MTESISRWLPAQGEPSTSARHGPRFPRFRPVVLSLGQLIVERGAGAVDALPKELRKKERGGRAFHQNGRARTDLIPHGYDPRRAPTENRLLGDRTPCYQMEVEKVGTQRKFTIWTAPASHDVPALVQLDMHAPIAGVTAARKRAANAKVRAKTALGYYVSRSSAESLRKLVK